MISFIAFYIKLGFTIVWQVLLNINYLLGNMLSTFCYRHFGYICIEHETYGEVDTELYLDEPHFARNPR